MQQQLATLRTAWKGMPPRARYAIMGVGAVTLVMMLLVLRAATSTTWVAIASDLPAEKLGQAETTLDEAGIKHQINETGTAIQVAKDNVPQAKNALLTTGIAVKGNRTGCAAQSEKGGSMMAKTSAETSLMLETCRENDAANDIESIDGVTKASVDVTVAEDKLFTTDESPAKASVMVNTDGNGLTGSTYKGIQSTVAGRFEGLSPSAVTITDETGSIKAGPGSDEVSGGDNAKLDAEARMNAKIQRDLTATFSDIVGEGNIQVLSNITLDMDEIDRTVLNNDAAGKNGEPLVEVEDYAKELLSGQGSAGAVEGVAGTPTNIGVDPDNRTVVPDIAANGDAPGDYASDEARIAYANNKVAEAIKVAKGAVVKSSIAVVVDDDVDPAAAQAVRDAAQAWMGGNALDSFSFSQAPIASAKPPVTDEGANAGAIGAYLKWFLLGVGLIGLAFVLRRSLTQRTAELLSPAEDLLMLDEGFAPIPIAELEAALAANQPEVIEEDERISIQRLVEQIADSKPHDVANELRRWMNQDSTEYASNPLQRKAG